ncbi:MAG TPA: chorismate mutase [Caulobacterales bacterium]|nr:chorismate mutase [Caulobacterales bacterium]
MSEPAPIPSPEPDPAAAVRAEMDKVDNAMLELLAQRVRLGDGLKLLKEGEGSSLPIRPAREVALLRRLIAQAPDEIEPDLVVELWRVLIGANVRRRGPVDILVGGGPREGTRLFDVARRHFGARTRIHRGDDPREVLTRAASEPNSVAVTPWLAAPGVGSWWPLLSESKFHGLYLVAALPVNGATESDPEAAVFAAMEPEPAGQDVTILFVQDRHHRAQRALADVGFVGKEVARSEPKALIRINGFVAHDDPRVAAMARSGLDGVRVLGSYARV